eukprot:TRINITY_DN88_c0_g1_i1.p1 TRINITY_DN88_c0_g1~~TRINITY_DN88_c0_g1_i1.p1  ORF type:complete len:426 (+),score=100.19 TRINITY_DN88_c0_g1_i1:91-1368(+)
MARWAGIRAKCNAWALLLGACCVSARHLVSTPPSRARPAFSWDTVPVYQHLADVNTTTGEWGAGRASWLAGFPIVVVEHAHAQGYLYEEVRPGELYGPRAYDPAVYGSGYFEDMASAAAADIKKHNTSTLVLYYQNGNGALPWFRTSHGAEKPEFQDASCPPGGHPHYGDNMVPNWDHYNWNHSAPGVAAHFVKALRQTAGGKRPLDGTFVDTNNCIKDPARYEALVDTARAMQAAAPELLVGVHRDGTSGAAFPGIGAAMSYTLAVPHRGQSGFDWLDANRELGVVSLAHIGSTLYDTRYNYSLAIFLAGAYEGSYFAFSSQFPGTPPEYLDCDPTAGAGHPPQHAPWPALPTWCAGQGYSPDYARPLGPPLAPAAPTGRRSGEVVRRFTSGTNVTVALDGLTCIIEWADGESTVCEGGARARP